MNTSWAATLTKKLLDQAKQAQFIAVIYIKKKDGHGIAQAYAAASVKESLAQGNTTSAATKYGIAEGLKINTLITDIKKQNRTGQDNEKP